MLRRKEKSPGCHIPRDDGLHVCLEGERWEREGEAAWAPQVWEKEPWVLCNNHFHPRLRSVGRESPERFELLRIGGLMLCWGRSILLLLASSIVLSRRGRVSAQSWPLEWETYLVRHTGPHAGLVLSFYCLEIFNNFWTKGPAFSVCPGPHKLCSCSYLHKEICANSESPA